MYLVFGLSLLSLVWGQMCYFPNGKLSPNDTPCPKQPDQKHSACCGKQSDGSPAICLSNNYCMNDLKISRGSCTDSTWEATTCPQNCVNKTSGGGWLLNACSGKNNLWSCFECAKGNFSIGTSDFRFSDSQLAAMGLSRTSNSASTTSGNSPTTGITSCPSIQGTINSTYTMDSKSFGPSATIVGAAVGTSLGVLLIVTVALLIFEKRKNNQRYRGMPAELASTTVGEEKISTGSISPDNSRPAEAIGRQPHRYGSSPPGYDSTSLTRTDGYTCPASHMLPRGAAMNELDGASISDPSQPKHSR